MTARQLRLFRGVIPLVYTGQSLMSRARVQLYLFTCEIGKGKGKRGFA